MQGMECAKTLDGQTYKIQVKLQDAFDFIKTFGFAWSYMNIKVFSSQGRLIA